MSEHRVPIDVEGLSSPDIAELKERERRGRDAGAPSYMERIGTRGAFRMRAEDLTLVRHIAPRRHQVVLDAGCGVGRHVLLLATRVARIIGLDFSAEALRVLSDEAKRRGLENVEVRQGDVCTIPDDLESLDTVYCSEVLQHVPSRAERLRAMLGFRRALKAGGRCVVNVLCWNRRVRAPRDGFWEGGSYCHYTTPEELRGLFLEAGFARVSLHGLLIAPGTLTRRLPPGLAVIEERLSEVPLLAGAGRFVIGVGAL